MQVNFNLINFTPKNRKQNYTSTPKNMAGNHIQDYSPSYYKDHNIAFGARLFRSPENFYEQDFNEKHMPKSLHKYIYESFDTDFRRTIPPAQAMKEVFGNINYAKDLDTVKLMYPEEPLFANLTSTPKRKSREGLLGMINLLKDDPDYKNKTLFKNGNNDLGMYILKKIYIEGKTLEEINKDFSKDVSVYFKSYDIKPQDYSAFGIRFPERSFWNSFLPTRKDRNFKYVKLPRNLDERIAFKKAAVQKNEKTNSAPPVKKYRVPMNFEQRKRMSEYMVNWHAGLSPEEKAELKRKQLAGIENSVMHKYFGEIVTIAQDKVNFSDKMADYMEKAYGKYDYLDSLSEDKMSIVMKRFWKENEMFRKDYSKAMLDTIKIFDDAYGQDGANYEFLALLGQARGIKQNLAENRQVREMLRAEIKAAKEASARNDVNNDKQLDAGQKQDKFRNFINTKLKENNAQLYVFKLSDGTEFNITANLKEMVKEHVDKGMLFFPQSFKDTYAKFIYNKFQNDTKYLLSLFYNVENLSEMYEVMTGDSEHNELDDSQAAIFDLFKKECLYTEEEILKRGEKTENEYNQKFKLENNALWSVLAEQAIELKPSMERIIDLSERRVNLLSDSAETNILDRLDLVKQTADDIRAFYKNFDETKITFLSTDELHNGLIVFKGEPSIADKEKIENRYKLYNKKLSKHDMPKLVDNILDVFSKANIDKLLENDPKSCNLLNGVARLLSKNSDARDIFKKQILQSNLITENHNQLRAFLIPDTNEKLLGALATKFILEVFNNNIELMKLMLSLDQDILYTYVRNTDIDLYNTIMLYRALVMMNSKK